MQSRILVLDLQTQYIPWHSEEYLDEITSKIIWKCTALSFSSDNLYLAAGNNWGKIWIFDTKTRDQVFYIDTQVIDPIQKIEFLNRDQKLVAFTMREKYQYNLRSSLDSMLLSVEKDQTLYTQDWRNRGVHLTEQNLVFIESYQKNQYLPIVQFPETTHRVNWRVSKDTGFVVFSTSESLYIFRVPRIAL